MEVTFDPGPSIARKKARAEKDLVEIKEKVKAYHKKVSLAVLCQWMGVVFAFVHSGW